MFKGWWRTFSAKHFTSLLPYESVTLSFREDDDVSQMDFTLGGLW